MFQESMGFEIGELRIPGTSFWLDVRHPLFFLGEGVFVFRADRGLIACSIMEEYFWGWGGVESPFISSGVASFPFSPGKA